MAPGPEPPPDVKRSQNESARKSAATPAAAAGRKGAAAAAEAAEAAAAARGRPSPPQRARRQGAEGPRRDASRRGRQRRGRRQQRRQRRPGQRREGGRTRRSAGRQERQGSAHGRRRRGRPRGRRPRRGQGKPRCWTRRSGYPRGRRRRLGSVAAAPLPEDAWRGPAARGGSAAAARVVGRRPGGLPAVPIRRAAESGTVEGALVEPGSVGAGVAERGRPLRARRGANLLSVCQPGKGPPDPVEAASSLPTSPHRGRRRVPRVGEGGGTVDQRHFPATPPRPVRMHPQAASSRIFPGFQDSKISMIFFQNFEGEQKKIKCYFKKNAILPDPWFSRSWARVGSQGPGIRQNSKILEKK